MSALLCATLDRCGMEYFACSKCTKCMFTASFIAYVGMACMFAKMLNAILFARQNPIYAVVYVLACFCEWCRSLFCRL